MYHPAAALRTPAIERESYADAATIPAVLLEARAARAEHATAPAIAIPVMDAEIEPAAVDEPARESIAPPIPEPTAAPIDTDQLTLF